jgi:hypothetical protein
MPLPSDINQLIAAFELDNYLEIGVNTGDTFEAINAPVRHAVDVNFGYDISQRGGVNCRYFKMRSDEYFICGEQFKDIDFSYIDGLHTFEQTLKDLLNVISLANERTIIMVDDCLPRDWFSSLPDQAECYKQRRTFTTTDFNWAWNGDVFKLVPFVHDFLPAFDYASYKDDGGQLKLLIWRARQLKVRKSLFGNLETISRLDYSDVEDLMPYYFEKTLASVIEELKHSRYR